MKRHDYAFPCAGCLCDHCANNLYSSDKMAGEAKIFCYDCESKSRPEWCPLKPLPEKKSTTAPVSNYEVQKNLFAAGWNSYIDKITGEGKDI